MYAFLTENIASRKSENMQIILTICFLETTLDGTYIIKHKYLHS